MPITIRQGPQSQPPWHCALRSMLRSGTRLFLVLRDREGLRRRPRGRFLRRRAEADGDRVLTGAHHAGQVDAVADEARVEAGDRPPVDRHFGDGVDEFEVEHRPFAGKRAVGQRRSERRISHSASWTHCTSASLVPIMGSGMRPAAMRAEWMSPGIGQGATSAPLAS